MSRPALVIWLLTPIVIVVGLGLLIFNSEERRMLMRRQQGTAVEADPAVLERPETLNRGFVLVARDVSGLATDADPIWAVFVDERGETMAERRLERRVDGAWTAEIANPGTALPGSEASAVSVRFERGESRTRELPSAGEARDARPLPLVDVARLKPNERPVLRFDIGGWQDAAPEGPSPSPASQP